MEVKELQQRVAAMFREAFGTTPLRQRLEDIQKEVLELCRYSDLKNLKEETGDALSSLMQLANEAGWSVEELIQANLIKINSRITQYNSLGRKVYVCILGGAFNMITPGHYEVAIHILNTSKTFDEVWFMPCYRHLYDKKMEHHKHRLAMCQLVANKDGRIKVFDYEVKNKLAGETYHFVKRLLDEDFAKKQYDFSMAIGMDNANTFADWVNYEDLERMMRFVVVPRKGEIQDPTVRWYLEKPHIYLLPDENEDNPIRQICSTDLRDWVKTDVDRAKENLDPDVFNYIKEHKLYGIGL